MEKNNCVFCFVSRIIHCKNMMVISTQNVVNSVACVVTRL